MKLKLFRSSKFFIILLVVVVTVLYKNFTTKNEVRMPQTLDVENAAFLVILGTSVEDIELKTNTRNKEFLTGRVIDGDIFTTTKPSESGKVFEIASVTKTFTAATLAKITSDPKYTEFFDKDDPIGTKLSAFEKLISAKANKNMQKYFAELKAKHPNYENITLRHLLNHSSGIVDNTWELEAAVHSRSNPDISFRLEDFYFPPKIDDAKFGQFSYSNPTYDNLLRPIIEAITDKKFEEVVRDEIIRPLQLTQTFMGDEVKNLPARRSDVKVVDGFDYCDGKMNPEKSYNTDSASGGMVASSADTSKFYSALVSGKLLGEKGNQTFFDERNFIKSDEVSSDKVEKSYGLGIRKAKGLEALHGTDWFHHGGASIGGYAHVIAQKSPDGEVQVASAIIAYENLTRPIAAALLGDEKKDEKGNFFTAREWKEDGVEKTDRWLIDKMNELEHRHSKAELIAMRNDLEKIKSNPELSFAESSQEFQKIYAQKYSIGIPSALPKASVSEQLEAGSHVRQ